MKKCKLDIEALEKSGAKIISQKWQWNKAGRLEHTRRELPATVRAVKQLIEFAENNFGEEDTEIIWADTSIGVIPELIIWIPGNDISGAWMIEGVSVFNHIAWN